MTPDPTTAPTVVFVPGLRDHVPDHWQTRLAARIPGSVTVPPLTEARLSRAAQVAALDAAVTSVAGPVVLVAHSAGVHTTVHWALTHDDRPVLGALLATPPDFDTPLPEGHPDPETLRAHGWLPVARARLPFPVIVAASTNDPLARPEKVAALAADWGGRLVGIGPVGHLNPASGHGEWPQAARLLEELGCPVPTGREAVK
ncbi:RBBP9/YdeN family alpha/beta hydrolase [Streptomyces xanthii]|uniref:Alpha/beta hydrolase n=1 Tax=Streptomyces xanthii TaxID=2768069 RepID=A0A7H1B1H8_9ACTN|nr:alpha/beta hydrolase [Streptomyces xanthii]QNS02583.1 alpha/beta hydrolase [Streptomyces xanthii]